jgi:hypothetical protein
MQTNQTILSFEGCSLPNDPVTAQKIHHGRPSKHITAAELTEIMQSLFNPAEKQLILKKHGATKIKHAINIFRTDFGKQGRISQKTCPYHKRIGLVYNWHGVKNGVRVACVIEGCLWHGTHFEPTLYHTEVMNDTGDSE